jgi:hypothetical protein
MIPVTQNTKNKVIRVWGQTGNRLEGLRRAIPHLALLLECRENYYNYIDWFLYHNRL